jgi:hypothetical protein
MATKKSSSAAFSSAATSSSLSASALLGLPQPLAGLAGYMASTCEVLEKVSSELVGRLRMLQDKIKQQQEQAAAEPKKGGSRWRSARTDKGSVTAYAKDVQDKHKQRMTEALSSSTFCCDFVVWGCS